MNSRKPMIILVKIYIYPFFFCSSCFISTIFSTLTTAFISSHGVYSFTKALITSLLQQLPETACVKICVIEMIVVVFSQNFEQNKASSRILPVRERKWIVDNFGNLLELFYKFELSKYYYLILTVIFFTELVFAIDDNKLTGILPLKYDFQNS